MDIFPFPPPPKKKKRCSFLLDFISKEIVKNREDDDSFDDFDDWYPVICFRKPYPEPNINFMGPFVYGGCERIRYPRHTAFKLFETSPDHHYAATFSHRDGILSVWRLDSKQHS